MEILTTDLVKQFSHGYKLLLPFEDLRSDQSEFINGEYDSWNVRIAKPNGEMVYKSGPDLDFPNSAVASIAVPINALDLNQSGTYQYQIVKTTDGIEVASDVHTFDVTDSLPVGLPIAPPNVDYAGQIAVYNGAGFLQGGGSRPPRMWIGRVEQIGTDAPEAVEIFVNTLGAELTFERQDGGWYHAICLDHFVPGRTFAKVTNYLGLGIEFQTRNNNEDDLRIASYFEGNLSDELLNGDTILEIYVYDED